MAPSVVRRRRDRRRIAVRTGSRVRQCSGATRAPADGGPRELGVAGTALPQTITCQTAVDARGVVHDGGTAPGHRNATRPTWHSAQVGRVEPLPARVGEALVRECALRPRRLHQRLSAGAGRPGAAGCCARVRADTSGRCDDLAARGRHRRLPSRGRQSARTRPDVPQPRHLRTHRPARPSSRRSGLGRAAACSGRGKSSGWS